MSCLGTRCSSIHPTGLLTSTPSVVPGVQLAKGPYRACTAQNNACIIICPVLSPRGDKTSLHYFATSSHGAPESCECNLPFCTLHFGNDGFFDTFQELPTIQEECIDVKKNHLLLLVWLCKPSVCMVPLQAEPSQTNDICLYKATLMHYGATYVLDLAVRDTSVKQTCGNDVRQLTFQTMFLDCLELMPHMLRNVG